MMNTVKYPNWDKVDRDARQWLYSQGTPEAKAPWKLQKGMVAYASVNGVDVKMIILKIVTSSSADTSAEAELIDIDLPDLKTGNIVFIKASDMKMCNSGDVDDDTL